MPPQFFGLRFLALGAPVRFARIYLNQHFLRHASHIRAFCAEMKHPEAPKRIKVVLSAKTKQMASKPQPKRIPSIGWIEGFCGIKENSVFCEVHKEYIQEDFNLTGLREQVEHYQMALEIILGRRGTRSDLEDDARKLYGLIHSRFITSIKGLDLMLRKFENAEFDFCPRTSCEQQVCLPVGISDEPGTDTLKYFCPRCQQIYTPISKVQADLDGAYFGTTFAHLLVMTYPQKFTRPRNVVTGSDYVPRIFGFRIHKTSE